MQDAFGTDRPFKNQQHKPQRLEEQPLEPSDELAIPIIESLACGEHRRLDAINVPNRGFIPNLPDEIVVEVPATSDGTGVHPKRMQPLPEPIAAVIRLQASINRLLVEALAAGYLPRPFSLAHSATWAREAKPNFERMLLTWDSMVR